MNHIKTYTCVMLTRSFQNRRFLKYYVPFGWNFWGLKLGADLRIRFIVCWITDLDHSVASGVYPFREAMEVLSCPNTELSRFMSR